MPYATDGTTPQCENIDIENQHTVRTSGLRKYFCVHTSDPLLDVVEWISYSTEVSCFHMRGVIHTSSFSQIGPIVIAAWLLILSILLLLPLLPWLPFLLQYLSFQHVVCPQVPALDVERLHPHPLTCILLLLHDKEDKHPSLAPGEDH